MLPWIYPAAVTQAWPLARPSASAGVVSGHVSVMVSGADWKRSWELIAFELYLN